MTGEIACCQMLKRKCNPMKTKNILTLTALSLLLSLSACSRQESKLERKPDSVASQGSWQGFQNGQNQASGSLSLSGNNLEFRSANGREWYKGTFTLHEDTNPKQMIVTIKECAFPKYVGTTANAIYRFENGTLTIAAYEPRNAAMPASFDAPGASVMDFKLQ